jgi:hypothetical protein
VGGIVGELLPQPSDSYAPDFSGTAENQQS